MSGCQVSGVVDASGIVACVFSCVARLWFVHCVVNHASSQVIQHLSETSPRTITKVRILQRVFEPIGYLTR